jgi:hypothetical protein
MSEWLQLEVWDMFWFARHRVPDLHRNELLAAIINNVRRDMPNRVQSECNWKSVRIYKVLSLIMRCMCNKRRQEQMHRMRIRIYAGIDIPNNKH